MLNGAFLFLHKASTVSTKSVSTSGSLQRSRSDIDVNAAASAKSKVTSSGSDTPFSSAAALPPGSYASLGKPNSFSLKEVITQRCVDIKEKCAF